ncbi:TIGR03086 family metal-binding protein [Streptomyces sp. NBC_01725]|uniref:TIGR03086 family metal-binding protein n=1 Tax=Streptomyces sp. NBC_01725 TaxID=2975923 RepID=UPI002E2BD344|nr:TIGR03086 family metal-binding protein [Streptomyces sp. NBC_01725]
MRNDTPPGPPEFTIGELAARTGLPVKLVRHWSDLGIAPPAGRSAAGYRRYGPEAVARLDLARTLRDLGLGLAEIRGVLDREHGLAETAAVHADALEAQIRTLRLQLAVLRSAGRRGSTAEELRVLTELTRMSAAEREESIRAFVTGALDGVDAPGYREALLAAMPDLPADPTAEQVDAWFELSALVRDPAVSAGLRAMAEYAAEHSPSVHEEGHVTAAERMTDFWVGLVSAAMAQGLAPDSPSADDVVGAVVAEWIPTQKGVAWPAGTAPRADGAEARGLLLAQLETAADPGVERYWQLVCLINGLPVRPGLAARGEWLMTALRANPAPGALAARHEALYARDAQEASVALRPDRIVETCAAVLGEVGKLVAGVGPDRFGDPTPCADWDVRALLGHLVWENLIWAGLAAGADTRPDAEVDRLGDDHAAAFRDAADAALTAFRRPGLTEERFGPAPGWRMVEQLLIEMLVHGWDLARATGRPTGFAPEIADAVLPSVRDIYGSLPRTAGGSFAPERRAPRDANGNDRLAAYLGREV